MQTSQIHKLYLLINLLVIGQTLVNAVTITAETLKSYGYNNESERVNLYIENVTNIDADAFNGYTKLTILYLASLTEFDLKVLRDCQNLSYLSLSNNYRLTNLTNSENLVFEELETLVLTNTSISTLPESVIKAFPNLASFYGFSISNLYPLTDNQLSPWSKLTSLQLTTNNQSRLTARMLTGLQSIQSIYFWSSNISVIDSDTFSNLSSLQTLDLMNNSIKSVNHLTFPKSLVFLRCASNNLSSLNFSQGPLPIHALDLGHNRFETFRSINFSQLVNLTMLILNSNPIRNPNEVWDQIKEARDLFSLSLNQIGIEAINSSIFQPFKRLQILSLKSNLIETIGEGSFATLSNLTTLSLINNSLTRLESNAFSGVGELKHLILNMNNISGISRGTFSRLEKLESLMLSDNKLKSIDSETFSGLTKLKSLSLNNNKIENVDLKAFNNLTSLQRINLDGNEIIDLDKSTFSGCINLVAISIKRNPKLRRLENMQEICPNPKCQVFYD